MKQRITCLTAAPLALSMLLLQANTAAEAQQYERWRLTWFAVVATPQGPVALRSPEGTGFVTEAECTAFGQRTTPRMEDWVRGAVRADWDHDVRVAFKCEPAGVPG